MSLDPQPPAERFMPEADLQRRAQHLTDSIAQIRPKRRVSRKALWVAGLASTVVASTGTAWAYQQFSEAAVTDEVRCYAMPDLGDGITYPGLTTTSQEMMSGQSMTAAEAINACTVSWTAGVLVEGDPQMHEPYEHTTDKVPQLSACIVEDGVAGVFPGGPGTCASLGLPQLTP